LDPDDFWSNRVIELVNQGYDPPLAYLNLLLKEVGPGKPLGSLTNEALHAFGESLDENWFPGLPGLFQDLRALAADYVDISLIFT